MNACGLSWTEGRGTEHTRQRLGDVVLGIFGSRAPVKRVLCPSESPVGRAELLESGIRNLLSDT